MRQRAAKLLARVCRWSNLLEYITFCVTHGEGEELDVCAPMRQTLLQRGDAVASAVSPVPVNSSALVI